MTRVSVPTPLLVTGSCSDQDDINDIYSPVGATLDNRWYYEGGSHGHVLYFDKACNGGTGYPECWIFGATYTVVSITTEHDLDLVMKIAISMDIVWTMEPNLRSAPTRGNCTTTTSGRTWTLQSLVAPASTT
jgi:hypothetical protein